jgi:hypothetical protein
MEAQAGGAAVPGQNLNPDVLVMQPTQPRIEMDAQDSSTTEPAAVMKDNRSERS